MSEGIPLSPIRWFHPPLARCSLHCCFERSSFSSSSSWTLISSPSSLIAPCHHCGSHFSPSSSSMRICLHGVFYAMKRLDSTISASVFASLSSSLTLAGRRSRSRPLSSWPHRIYIPVIQSAMSLLSLLMFAHSRRCDFVGPIFLCLELFLCFPFFHFAIILNLFTGLNGKSNICCSTPAFLL